LNDLKKTLVALFFLCCFGAVKAQKIDSIYVNLYTDSLKKGQYNYINVDGLMSNGKYIPLDSSRIDFSCAEAKFYGNTLFIPANFSEQKVKIKVALKADEKKYKEFEVYIKTLPDPPLKSESEIMGEIKGKARTRKG
jgi:hypothetical protein